MDPFIYNFVCGGAIFVFGLVLAWRQGSLGLSGKGRRNLCLVLGVFGFYFILQAFLQYKAPGMPAARRAQHGDDPVARPQPFNAGAQLHHHAGHLAAGDESSARHGRPTPG